MFGRFNWPTPATSTSARTSSPLTVRIFHTAASLSQLALAISVPKRICRMRSYFFARSSMYSRISDCGAHFRDQSVFCSNEKQYENDGTSQAAPGYVFSRQVPPSRSAFSKIVNESIPSLFSWIPRQSPEKPDPIIAIRRDAREFLDINGNLLAWS